VLASLLGRPASLHVRLLARSTLRTVVRISHRLAPSVVSNFEVQFAMVAKSQKAALGHRDRLCDASKSRCPGVEGVRVFAADYLASSLSEYCQIALMER